MLISNYMKFNFDITYNVFCSKGAALHSPGAGAGAAAPLLLKIWSGSGAPILGMERERRSNFKHGAGAPLKF